MRQLLPVAQEDVELESVYALPDVSTRHLRVNMVSSADGAAALAGRVGALTGPADQVLLHTLRALADVVLVGAGTVRAEGYGPLLLSEQWQQQRVAAGQRPSPPLALVSRSLDLDLAGPAFTQAVTRPLLVTVESAPSGRLDQAAAVADVVIAGKDDVDLPTAVAALAERGLRRVLSEGGPHLLAQLFAADLVDELCLAVAPLVTCGEQLRVTSGALLQPPTTLRLAHLLEEEDYLFLRYTRTGPSR